MRGKIPAASDAQKALARRGLTTEQEQLERYAAARTADDRDRLEAQLRAEQAGSTSNARTDGFR